jgi:hypothetical protein
MLVKKFKLVPRSVADGVEACHVLNQHRRQRNQQFLTLHNYITLHNSSGTRSNFEQCSIICGTNI